jgi:hypothetical protein
MRVGVGGFVTGLDCEVDRSPAILEMMFLAYFRDWKCLESLSVLYFCHFNKFTIYVYYKAH